MGKSKKRGFTLIELMIVIAIIALLSMVAVPQMLRYVAKAKRAEAYAFLSSLASAQKAHFAEHGVYATTFGGATGLAWKPEGNHAYTYGFSSGQQGSTYFLGSLKAPATAFSGGQKNKNGFSAYAAADIDGDGDYDLLSVDQTGAITILKDDLVEE